MPKPALGPVKVGDTLLVFLARYSRDRTPPAPIEATVIKVGRVWIELQDPDSTSRFPRTWRLRLDTQDDASKTNYHDRFVTTGQFEWEQQVAAARAAVASLKLDWTSPWQRDEDRLLALAAFVAAYDADHPTDAAA